MLHPCPFASLRHNSLIEVQVPTLTSLSHRVPTTACPCCFSGREDSLEICHIPEFTPICPQVNMSSIVSREGCQLRHNIVRILEAISPEADAIANGLDEIDDLDGTEDAGAILISAPGGSTPSYGTQVPKYDSYRRRLAPLADLEVRLIQQLSDPEDNGNFEATRLPLNQNNPAWNYSDEMSPTTTGWGQPVPRINIPSGSRSSPASPTSLASMSSHQELTVPTTFNWKKAFALGKIQSPKSAHSGGELQGWWEDPDDPVHVLHRCSVVIVELWRDPKVKQKLKEKRLRLEESSGL